MTMEWEDVVFLTKAAEEEEEELSAASDDVTHTKPTIAITNSIISNFPISSLQNYTNFNFKDLSLLRAFLQIQDLIYIEKESIWSKLHKWTLNYGVSFTLAPQLWKVPFDPSKYWLSSNSAFMVMWIPKWPFLRVFWSNYWKLIFLFMRKEKKKKKVQENNKDKINNSYLHQVISKN